VTAQRNLLEAAVMVLQPKARPNTTEFTLQVVEQGKLATDKTGAATESDVKGQSRVL
jgi:hypothetical protein